MTLRSRVPLLAAALALAGATPAAAGAPARVTYVTGASVYVDAGESEGVRIGDTLTVVRGGGAVGGLRAAYLSFHRVACETLWTRAAILVGDTVAFVARPAPPRDPARADSGATTTGTPDRAGTTPRPRGPALGLHGRVGARLLTVDSDPGARLTQPSLDLALTGTRLGGRALDLALDLRGRRVTTRAPGGATRTSDRTRLHRASLAAHDGPGRRWITLGRMPAPSLAAVSVFDGALAEHRGTRWDAGVFAGTQPEPVRLAWSGDRVQAGMFARWHDAAGAGTRRAVTAGLASSTDHGQPDRDFAFVQAGYAGPALSASLQQEVDANRGWKRDRGLPALSLSGTHALLSWRVRAAGPLHLPGPGLTARAGLDRRRDVWLWRDRTTPETEFDDRTRQGGWAGLALDGLGPLRLSGEGRVTTIAGGERQTGWSGALESDRRGRANLAGRVRAARLTGAGLTNTLVAAGAGIDPSDWAHLELSGGLRRTEDTFSGVAEEVRWEGIDLDLVLPRHTYLDASFEDDHGGSAPMRTFHASLTLRF